MNCSLWSIFNSMLYTCMFVWGKKENVLDKNLCLLSSICFIPIFWISCWCNVDDSKSMFVRILPVGFVIFLLGFCGLSKLGPFPVKPLPSSLLLARIRADNHIIIMFSLRVPPCFGEGNVPVSVLYRQKRSGCEPHHSSEMTVKHSFCLIISSDVFVTF